MQRVIDGDALKIARAETEGDPPSWLFGGQTFVLRPAQPWEPVVAFIENTAASLYGAVKALLGEDGMKKAAALGANTDDFVALLTAANLEYGSNPEGRSSSARSSKRASKSLKRTSNGSTGSISAANSGEKTPQDGGV